MVFPGPRVLDDAVRKLTGPDADLGANGVARKELEQSAAGTAPPAPLVNNRSPDRADASHFVCVSGIRSRSASRCSAALRTRTNLDDVIGAAVRSPR